MNQMFQLCAKPKCLGMNSKHTAAKHPKSAYTRRISRLCHNTTQIIRLLV